MDSPCELALGPGLVPFVKSPFPSRFLVPYWSAFGLPLIARGSVDCERH
jgi:hypothetical protein